MRHIKVKVTPSASKELLREVGEYELEIFVREPAQKNMANNRVREIVAAHYGAPIKSARIETGHRSRNKVISITI
jgi:uncharacterized protein YggU (UPF0235/DUF167 family)